MSESSWFYESDGERAGPVSLEELRRLRSGGALGADSLVWCEGMSDWRSFSEAVPAEIVAVAEGGAKPGGPPPVPAAGPSRAGAAAGGVMVPMVPTGGEPVREVALRPGFEPRFRATFGLAWRRFTGNFWPFVGCFALTSILIGAASYFVVPVLFMMFPLLGGLSWYYLQHLRGRPVTVDAIFFGFKRRFGDLAILNLIVMIPFLVLYLIAMAVFFVVFFAAIAAAEGGGGDFAQLGIPIVAIVVVGVIVSIIGMLAYSVVGAVLNLAILAVLDGDLPWKVALSRSWQAAKPHLFKLALIYFAAVGLAGLGTLALYVGAFIFGAWGHLALVTVYEDAFGDEPTDKTGEDLR